MQELQIPTFLLTDVSGSSQDRRNLLGDLQLLLLWREFHGFAEPYDPVRAAELQERLHRQREAILREGIAKKAIERTRAEKEAIQLHQGIVELLFGVEVIGNPDEVRTGEVGWNQQIKDKISGKNIGNPRTLMNSVKNFEWRCKTDARDNLEQYLGEVKTRYDDFSYGYFFRRESVPRDSRCSHYATFEIRLFWRSIGISSRTRRKLRALVSKTKKG